MSADQRGPSSTALADERTRITRSNPLVEPPARDDSPPDGAAVRSPSQVPLAYRIERTRLQTQVAALERAIATSEHRRQTVIDRYEQLLADRDEATETDSRSAARSLLARLGGR